MPQKRLHLLWCFAAHLDKAFLNSAQNLGLGGYLERSCWLEWFGRLYCFGWLGRSGFLCRCLFCRGRFLGCGYLLHNCYLGGRCGLGSNLLCHPLLCNCFLGYRLLGWHRHGCWRSGFHRGSLLDNRNLVANTPGAKLEHAGVRQHGVVAASLATTTSSASGCLAAT